MKKNEGKKNVVKIIGNILFWGGISIVAITWILDFKRLQSEEEPLFCVAKKSHKFKDGTVEECIGLGYKIYKYNRESINGARQFSPFYIPMKK